MRRRLRSRPSVLEAKAAKKAGFEEKVTHLR